MLPNGFCGLTLTFCRDFYKTKQNEWETNECPIVQLANAHDK